MELKWNGNGKVLKVETMKCEVSYEVDSIDIGIDKDYSIVEKQY